MNEAKIEAVQRPLIVENNALRRRAEKAEAAIREAHRALAASYGNASHAFNVLGAALAKMSPPSVGGDDGGHIGAMPGYDPLTRSVSEPRPNTTRGLCPECLDDSGLDSLYKYGVMTEHLAQLAAALGLREGKHTADSVARIAIERLVLAPRSETARRASTDVDATTWDRVKALLGLDFLHGPDDVIAEIEMLQRGTVPVEFACRHCGDTYQEGRTEPCGGASRHEWQPTQTDRAPLREGVDYARENEGHQRGTTPGTE